MAHNYLLLDGVEKCISTSPSPSLKHRTIVALLKWYARLPQ